jgi:hypothetical protein
MERARAMLSLLFITFGWLMVVISLSLYWHPGPALAIGGIMLFGLGVLIGS